MTIRYFLTLFFCSTITCCIGQELHLTDFKSPPASARPKTWMHAMSGNMSKAGMKKDLEAMADVGIGGLLLFNVTQGIPIGNVKYNSQEHRDIIAYAAKQAERLGITFGVHNCDGWSSSGGPWVLPKESMKMIVWSEKVVRGNENLKVKLNQPTTRNGFYKDIAVIAYPSLASEVADATAKPKITASDPNFDIALATDGKIEAKSKLKKIDGKNPWIQFEYAKPHTLRSVWITFTDRFGEAKLQVSKNGKVFHTVKELFKVRTGKGEWAINDHFKPVISTYFRLQLNGEMNIKEAKVASTYLMQNPLGRTAMARTENRALQPIGNPEKSMIIDKNKIIDLSDKMDDHGNLSVKLPQGNWTLMRFGQTSTGAFNNPASKEGRGLEVDKLSRAPLKKHYDAFVEKVVKQSKPLAPNAFQYVEIDSYEMGGQNWTTNFDRIFKKRNGYDFISFLPLIAGKFVESPQTSEAVLYDFRGTISDLMTKNYFGYFQELCHADGLKTYIEPYGFGPLNDLDVGKHADKPMGEFWMNRPYTWLKPAVSSAHIYGKPIISSESFTSGPKINWKGNPAMAKLSGDGAWARGINEFMFHRFVHQANTHVVPGMTMNRWGFHMDRTQTWWYNAGAAWFKYIARGQYLLRQGISVNDLLIYVGEGSPNSTYARKDFKTPIPCSINFDNANTDVLLHRLKIKNRKLVLPEGNTYKALVLKNTEKLSLKTLKRLNELAENGVPLFGEAPKKIAGYKNSKADKEEFAKLAAQLKDKITASLDWKKLMSRSNIKPDLVVANRDTLHFMHRKAKKEDIYFLFNPDSTATVMNASFRINSKIPEFWNPMNGESVKSAQFENKNGRTLVSIPLKAKEAVFVIFKENKANVAHVLPQKLNTEEPHVKYQLNKNNAICALVNKNGEYQASLSTGQNRKFAVNDISKPITITGPWQVQFDKKRGFGRTVTFNKLADWKDNANDSIKYYSGTATYTKTIDLPNKIFKKNTPITLDLGKVNIVAEVKINGKDVGVLWIAPFKKEVTKYLKPGKNTVEIAITNQWSNKLIGDQRFPPNDDGYHLDSYHPTTKMPQWYINNEPRPKGKRTTFTTANFYKKDDPLMPSGLLGPVTLEFSKVIEVAK